MPSRGRRGGGWRALAGVCVVLKRSMNVGYAGIANPLFFHERTRMFFGDAKDNVLALVQALKGRLAA